MAKNQIRIFFFLNLRKAQKSLKRAFVRVLRFRGKKPPRALRLSVLLTTLIYIIFFSFSYCIELCISFK